MNESLGVDVDAYESLETEQTASRGRANGRAPRKFELTFVGEGKKQEMKLPRQPDAVRELPAWLTCAFGLDPKHRILDGNWAGPRGGDGVVLLSRLGAPTIRFEPARRISRPQLLVEDFVFQRIGTDPPTPAFKTEHCRQIGHAINRLCDNSARATAADETAAIVDAFLHDAEPLEGFTTYGTSQQHFEAANALRRPAEASTGPLPLRAPNYLIDHGQTGEVDNPEFVIRVSDLHHVARRLVGSKPWTWLDARMEEIGWARVALDGHAEPGRAGRQGAHARCHVYRGRR